MVEIPKRGGWGGVRHLGKIPKKFRIFFLRPSLSTLAVGEEGRIRQSSTMIGESIKNIHLLSGKVDEEDRFAIISTGHQVWKYKFAL